MSARSTWEYLAPSPPPLYPSQRMCARLLPVAAMTTRKRSGGRPGLTRVCSGTAAVLLPLLYFPTVATATADSSAATAGQSASELPKVFGLGPGRTGTDSLKEALTTMGFGPTYHMKEALFEEAGISTLGHFPLWQNAATGGEKVDFRVLLKGWNSGVDYPLSSFPEELIAAFPNAKFILTKRPAKKWFKSINSTICAFSTHQFPFSVLQHLPVGPFPRFASQTAAMDDVIKHKFAPGFAESWAELCSSEDIATAAVAAWNTRVQQLIPPEQLFIFDLEQNDGYMKLAEFLNVEVPDTPYPRSNSTIEMKTLINVFRVIATALVVGGPLAAAYLLRRLVTFAGGVARVANNTKME